MGRERLTDGGVAVTKTRTVRFEMRLSEDEAAVLQDMADRKGVSKVDILRMLLLDASRKDRLKECV